ncbi:hypothetical protein G7Y41_06315 [Schaalia sp. ZJ405]|uniref:MSCRAMM family protein n=1 Tax=Schaalia sp. ZJ405 TaxID=2709403 RepID=UPI0013EC5F06|nr:SpaA isopeptide-forming pilin-related protein [Schaalia sp. ZJ405]QPK80692.1 hypothetical protein G7Y41_06315 [Schaalia sp. ZJ405]
MRESKVKMAAVFAATCALSLVHLAPAIAQTDQGETWDEGTTAVAEEGAAAVSETEAPESGDVVNAPAEDTPRFGSDRSAAGAAEAPVGSDRSATGAEVAPAGSSWLTGTKRNLDPEAFDEPVDTRITYVNTPGGPRKKTKDRLGTCLLDETAAATPGARGIVVMTSTGELYNIKPGTENCNIADQMEPLPFLKKGSGGQNFNALGTAPDGTMYVIERAVGKWKDANGRTVLGSDKDASNRVVVQVWKLAPGAREWTGLGSRFVTTEQFANNQPHRKLEIQGGAVDPVSGNYFFGGTGVRRINPKRGDAPTNLRNVYYLFEADASSGVITPRGWAPLIDQGASPSDVTLNLDAPKDGDLLFTTTGDLLIGFGHKKQKTFNKLDVISVPSSQLRLGNSLETEMTVSGRMSFDLEPFAYRYFSEVIGCKYPNIGGSGCHFPPLFAATGFSVSPGGSLLISANMLGDGYQWESVGAVYEITPGVTTTAGHPPTKIQEMPAHPPVEVIAWKNDPSETWHVLKPETAELWKYPVSGREQHNGPWRTAGGTRYVYDLRNLKMVDMDGFSEPFASITAKVDIVSRKNANDQFIISASTGGNSLGKFTTTGSTTGVQNEKVGPLPIPAGQTVRLKEEITQGSSSFFRRSSSLNDYHPRLLCVDGEGHDVSGTVVDGLTANDSEAYADVTIPAAGGAASALTCTFVNDPDPGSKLVSIAVSKQDADGHKPLAGAAFTLCADKDDNGAYSEDDCAADGNGEDRVTNGDGLAEWKEKAFGTYFLVEKKAPEGYTITKTAKSLPTEYPQAVDANGKAVEGVYKVVLSADALNASGTMTGVVLNERIPGTVTWTKVDAADTGQALGGSEWTLRGPDGRSVRITDCATGTGTTCQAPGAGSFADTDPKKGSFKLTKLPWGRYTLKESKAPAGYALSNETYPVEINRELVIGDHHGVLDLGQITNAKAKLPILPFTGGMSADIFRLSALGVFGLTALSALCLRRRKVVRSSSTQS